MWVRWLVARLWTRAGGGIWQTHLAQNETPQCMGVRVSPGPPTYTPVAEQADAARSKRASTCRFESCREYCSAMPSHAPDRTVTVAASKTAIRGSIPRGCAMWEMPKWTRRLSAKQFLPGSSPGSHSIGGREATATLSGPENQRAGKHPDGGSTPPPSATHIRRTRRTKALAFCDRFTYYVIESWYKLSISGKCRREPNPRASAPLMRVKVHSPV